MSPATALLLLALQTGPPPGVTGLLAALAAALSDGNAAAFLRHFDKSMPGYGTLETDIYALTAQADLGCSVQIASDQGDGRNRALELDWILEVTGKEAAAPTERRHQTIRVKLEHRGKAWVIVSLDPVAFFGPPKPAPYGRGSPGR